MKRLLLSASLLAAVVVGYKRASGQKQARPDSLADHSRILFENDKVRVTEFDGQPGTQTEMRESNDYVLYPLKGCEYKATSADGKTIDVTLKPGKVHWQRGVEESDRIVGDRACHYIRVELKEPKPESGSRGG